jgi:hypothetical protein
MRAALLWAKGRNKPGQGVFRIDDGMKAEKHRIQTSIFPTLPGQRYD